MDALTSAPPVHFYDTVAHLIVCGVHGVEHRSTKHARSVTCQACVSLLVKRQTAVSTGADATIGSVAR